MRPAEWTIQVSGNASLKFRNVQSLFGTCQAKISVPSIIASTGHCLHPQSHRTQDDSYHNGEKSLFADDASKFDPLKGFVKS
jgi:hypothetical protein